MATGFEIKDNSVSDIEKDKEFEKNSFEGLERFAKMSGDLSDQLVRGRLS